MLRLARDGISDLVMLVIADIQVVAYLVESRGP
jgi:hypothetical protein